MFAFFLGVRSISQGGPVGRDLDDDTSEALSDEQTAKLDDLAAAARSASGDDEGDSPSDPPGQK